MSSGGAVDALKRFRAHQSKAKQLDVLEAIQDLSQAGSDLTISAVARTARVSREFIHSHPSLHQAVKNAARLMDERDVEGSPREHRPDVSLRAERSTLIAEVERLRKQVESQQEILSGHEKQRRLWLGSQLTGSNIVDPEEHTELRMANDRLVSDLATLTRVADERVRLIGLLQSELSASRQAHAEDVRRFTDAGGEVVSLDEFREK